MATTKAVNRPTDPALRDRDIEKKLQIYGMVTAFGNGKVPTNQQIDVAMNSALAWKPLANPPNTLSRDGQVLCQDLREVIQRAKELVLSKNSGNLFQDFTWQTRHIGQGDAGSVNAPVSKDTANQHANEAAENLRTLGRLLITNGQFRKLLNDATILLRDVAGDAAQKTANKVNPSEEQLSQIDQAEQDHTWHDTPDFSRENLKQQAQARAPVGKETLKQAAGDATQSADPQGARNPDDAAQRAQQSRDTTGMDPRSGAKSGFDTISRNMDENQKQRLREQRERAANYVDSKFPKERREQVIYRLKKMVVECQEHREYQQAIDGLLRLAEEYQGHAKNAGQQGVSNVQGGRNQSSVGNAEYDLKTLLERFANGTSFDDVIEAVNQIYRDADNDRELRDWFKSLDTYIRKVLKTEGYILDDKATQEYNQIHEKGDYLLRQKYKQHFDRVIDEVKYVGQQFDRDPQNKALAHSLEKLFHDLGKDASGNQAFKPHLLKDLNDVILPSLFKEIGYIPVPRIEYTDPMIDAVVENLILEGDNMAPNVLEFGSDNYFKWTRGVARDQNRNKNNAMIGVSGIQMDMRDIAYYIKKKQGFPAVTDKGVMDIFFGGSGISFKVALETADKSDQQHFFKIKQVTIDIQNMDIKVKQSNHKLLFSLFKPLLLKVVKPVVQKVLEKQIRDQVTYWDGVAYNAKKEGDSLKAQADRNPDPNNQKSIYQYYYEAFQNQLQREKAKKPAPPPPEQKGQTNVAITQHDSILKNVQLPGGFSTKATKYNDMAKQGDKWESPIFNLGSASESRNIQATNVTRRGGKPTNTSSTAGAGAAGAGLVGAGAGATTFSSDATNRAGQLDPGRATELSREAPIVQPATIGSGSGTGQSTLASNHPDYRGNFGPEPRDGHTTLGSNNPLLPGSNFPGNQ